MLNKWSCALVFIIMFLLMVPGAHAERQHESAEEEENGSLSDELEEESFLIELNADPVNGGTVTGGGSYEEGTEITVTANANDGFEFVHWLEIVTTTEEGEDGGAVTFESEIVVSKERGYSFNVIEDLKLIANFEKAMSEEDDPSDIYEYPNFKDLTEKHGYPSAHVEWVFNNYDFHNDSIKLSFETPVAFTCLSIAW